MPNSLDAKFLGLILALAEDAIALYPSLRMGLSRDVLRLESLASNMGTRIFTEHLPSLRKSLDFSISTGSLHLEGPLTRSRSAGSRIPRLFQGMWLHLFDDSGCLRQSIDHRILTILRSILDVGNKFEGECPSSAKFAETREFYRNDVTLPSPSPLWDVGRGDVDRYSSVSLTDQVVHGSGPSDLFAGDHGDDTKLLATIQRVADVAVSSFGLYNPLEGTFRHGPGAVSDGLRGIGKYRPNRWSERLSELFPALGTSVPLGWDHPTDESEIPSRLLAVPKTMKGPRLIAAEPSDNLWCQFSIMEFLYDGVSRSALGNSITFRDQEPSRRLAQVSSLTRSHATVDLKSASDRVSCWLVERIFRRNTSLLDALVATRTRYIDLSIDKKLPSLHKLRKFSTQGSACTFPVQSIIFACIAIGCLMGDRKVTLASVKDIGRQVRVYGDDIILPSTGYTTLKRALEVLFLKVNTTKTHYLGRFRESCGMDAFDGEDVTPPHVTRFLGQSDLSGLASVVEARNNFYLKKLFHAAEYLRSTIPSRVSSKIPERRMPDKSICFRTFHREFIPEGVKSRWNDELQVREYQIPVVKTVNQALEADATLHLCAFLARAENTNRDPDSNGVTRPMSFSSRWESKEKISLGWVTLG